MTYQKLQTTVQRELLYQIITNLRNKRLSHSRAKRTAQVFLPILKSEDVSIFLNALTKISYSYPEILEASIVAVGAYEKEKVTAGLSSVRNFLQEVLPSQSSINGGLPSEALAKGGEE
ncbi:MAG: hypothetical protein Q7T54_02585 [Candidatus Levybacteria bacterium]|nr:hypothetical protein [Candidatus Levybacteria bacterium]